MINLYLNNASTTLTTVLYSYMTSLPSSYLTSDIFSSIGSFEQQFIATLIDGNNMEIITITKNPAGYGPYEIARAQENTMALEWNIGTKVELRITASMLSRLVTNEGNYSLKVGESYGASYSIKHAATRPTSGSVSSISNRVLPWGSTGIYLRSGVTGSSLTNSGITSLAKDGTCLFASTDTSDYTGGTAISGFASNSSIAIGATAIGTDSIGIGRNTITTGAKSISIGLSNINTGTNTVVIGNTISTFLNNSLVTSVIPAKPVKPTINGTTFESNLSGMLWSKPLDFTGGSTWSSGQSYSYGRVTKPSTPNGYQYISADNKYLPLDKFDISVYTAGVSGSYEPTWPTTQDASTSDDTPKWVCIPNVGYTIALPSKFVVEEIGIVIFESTGVTVQPSVSFGKTGSTSMFVANQTTTGLTDSYKTQRWIINSSEAVDNLVININTLATGTTLLGQVYFKGFYLSHWL